VVRRPAAQKSNTELTSSLRANFRAAQTAIDDKHHTNSDKGRRPDYTAWTSKEDGSLFVPSIDFTNSGLAEERSQYEITVKLFFLPNQAASCRCAQTREAVNLVLKELHISSIDLLIVSYPGITFDADDDVEEDSDEDIDGTKETDPSAEVQSEDVDAMIKTWECLEELHDKGVITRLGVSEFGADRLAKFLAKARVRPSVDQINVRDCCVVPRPLILYAKQEKIELLTHNDCTNVLPRGTLREMLGSGEMGVGVLADDQSSSGLKGEVTPQWVIKYTVVITDRGVIENKGYFALAELQES